MHDITSIKRKTTIYKPGIYYCVILLSVEVFHSLAQKRQVFFQFSQFLKVE